MSPLNEYGKVQFNNGGRFYCVHIDGGMFYCGVNELGDPIWSDNLQDCEIHCAESAEYITDWLPGTSFDPITVDLHLVA